MKFEFGFSGPGRRNLIIGLVVLVVIASIIVIVVRSRSTYQFPIPASDTSSEGSTLTSAISACTTKYRQALQSNLTDSTPTKAQCVQTAVAAYFNSKCPFVATGTAPSVAAGQSTAQVTAYTAYAGSAATGGGNAGAVTGSEQYINLLRTLTHGVTSTIVTKSRKADLTGPTRKYIETACPGFYKPPDANSTDFTSVYTSWTNSSSSASVPTTASSFGFYSPNVTAPRVYEWALKAGTPITVSTAVAADEGASTTKTISVSGSLQASLSAKVKVAGITGDVTATATAGSTSITLTYTSQTVGAIAAGTVVNKSTASAINSVTFATGGAVSIPNTANTPTTAITSVTLTVGSALDDSLMVGSQVLISGSTISGPITIASISGTAIGISFNSQVFPILPTGSVIENVVETPLASPLVTSVPVYVTSAGGGSAAAATSLALTVNATGTAATVALPTTAATAIVVTVPTVTFPAAAVVLKAYINVGGTTLTLLSFASNGSAASVTWPTIPGGTVIFDSAGNPFITTLTSNTLYNKVGTMAGDKMLNWQIAQVVGPGTYWNSATAGTSAITWGI